MVGTVLFVLAVVALPRRAVWPYAADAVIVATVVAAAGLRTGAVLRRLVIEVPFLLAVALLPLIGSPPNIDVLGVSLSVPGLWATWSIGMKATLGIAAATVLGSTTRPADIVEGLERLRCPRTVTVIAGFMVRYVDVVGDELRRLAVARVSRGDDPRWIGQVRAAAMTVGTMFVRSYERGERVHQAMVARGFSGTVPPSTSRAVSGGWLRTVAPALVPALGATVVCSIAWAQRHDGIGTPGDRCGGAPLRLPRWSGRARRTGPAGGPG